MDEFGDRLSGVFTAYIGRIVAFVLAPLLAFAVPPVVEALNNVLGTDFSNQQVSNIAIATIVGIALALWQWLRNRGDWETKLAELEALYESGKQNIDASMQVPPAGRSPEGPSSSALGMNEPPGQ